jgi:hypothetical protein
MLAVVEVFALWTALMWLGWALVYLPNLGDFSHDSAVLTAPGRRPPQSVRDGGQ